MLDANVLLPTVLGAILGSALALLWGSTHLRQRVSELNEAHGKQMAALEQQSDQRIAELQILLKGEAATRLHETEVRHEEQMRKVESPLTVVVHPFVNTSTDKGLIRSSSQVEVGYKYQLLIQGIPCFPPHDVVVERQNNVVIDKDALVAMGNKALELAEAAVQIKGGGLAGKLITVAKTVLQNRK